MYTACTSLQMPSITWNKMTPALYVLVLSHHRMIHMQMMSKLLHIHAFYANLYICGVITVYCTMYVNATFGHLRLGLTLKLL